MTRGESQNVVTGSQKSAAVQDLLIKAWACAFSENSLVYLSGPITTGPRFLSWYSKFGRTLGEQSDTYKLEIRRNVIFPNERDLIDAARELRQRLTLPVLEPASLAVDGWTQADYHSLWVRVIERFTAKMLVIPGWEYSAGSVVEFCAAVTRSVPVETLDGQPIDVPQGLLLIERAVSHYRSLQVPARKLDHALQHLTAVSLEHLTRASP